MSQFTTTTKMINVLSVSPTQTDIVLRITNCDLPIINSLRRVILSNITNSGIEEDQVTIIKNTSVLNDEIIQHRISLIPFRSLEHCELSLDVINTKTDTKYVTSSDCMLIAGKGQIYKDIVICPLKQNEEIKAIIRTNMGTGSKNIAYRPTSMVYFKPLLWIYIAPNIKEQFLQACQNLDFHVFQEQKESEDKLDCIGFSDNMTFLDNDEICKIVRCRPDLIRLEISQNEYAFFIESFFTCHSGKKILNSAIHWLHSQFQDFRYEKYQFNLKTKSDADIIFKESSETLINPIAFYLKQHRDVLHCQYRKQHPQQKAIVLTIYTTIVLCEFEFNELLLQITKQITDHLLILAKTTQ